MVKLNLIVLLCFTLNGIVICQVDDSPTANVFDSFDLSGNNDNLDVKDGIDTIVPEVNNPNNDTIESDTTTIETLLETSPTMPVRTDTQPYNINSKDQTAESSTKENAIDGDSDLSSTSAKDFTDIKVADKDTFEEITTEDNIFDGDSYLFSTSEKDNIDKDTLEETTTKDNEITGDTDHFLNSPIDTEITAMNKYTPEETTTEEETPEDISNPQYNAEFPVKDNDVAVNEIDDSFKKKNQSNNRINSKILDKTNIITSNKALPTKIREQTTPATNTNKDYIIDEVVKKVKQIVESSQANSENFPESNNTQTRANLKDPSTKLEGKVKVIIYKD